VFAATGKPISDLQRQWKQGTSTEHRLCVLTWDRQLLDRRINQRVDAMMSGGFLQEVSGVLARGGFGRESSQALGYREAVACLAGEATEEETADLIKRRTRRFARGQLTWFRKWDHAQWVHGDEDEPVEALVDRVRESLGLPLSP